MSADDSRSACAGLMSDVRSASGERNRPIMLRSGPRVAPAPSTEWHVLHPPAPANNRSPTAASELSAAGAPCAATVDSDTTAAPATRSADRSHSIRMVVLLQFTAACACSDGLT